MLKHLKDMNNTYFSYGNTLVLAIALFFASNIFANPVVNNVTSGQVSIQQTPTTTTINQTSQKAIINWHSFNINNNEATHFQQPAGGIALNRISPTQGASQIYGTLTATGKIILINPAGIYFGPSAYVNVGGLIATTANLSDQDFLNGQYHFSNPTSYSGSIVNEGKIIAAQNGMLALVGSNVTNRGVIQANLGYVVLASGEAFTLNFSGDNLVNFTIDQPSPAGKINNTGSIYADGGTIQISSSSASHVLDQAINLEGVLQAKSVYEKNGKIIISGNPKAGVIRIAGKIDASGNSKHKGGRVEITGYNILLDSNTNIDVSGGLGGGNILVGGNYQGKGPLPNANAVVMMPNAILMADANDTGNGGEIILWSDQVTKAYGTLSARGGINGGDGGFIETSSHGYLDVNSITVSTIAPLGKIGSWLLDPSDLTLSNAATSNVAQASGTFTADNNSNTSNLQISTLVTQLGSTAVTVLTTSGGSGTGNGDITVANDISWTTANSLTISAYRNLTVNGNITSTNASARLTLKGNNEGAPAFTVGSGNGVVTVNGTLTIAGPVDIYYNPSAYSSPTTYTNTGGTVTAYMYVNVAADVSLPGNSSNTNSFALSKNIDMTGTPHSPIATFNGTFDGQGFAISNITMNAFISSFGGTIKNLGFVNPTVFNTISGAAVFALGGLNGFITDSYVTGGTLTFAGLTPAAASFIAFPVGGSVTNSTSSLTITGTSTNAANIGGIIGGNAGTVSNSSYTGTITLDTQGAGTNNIGGICGDFCTISNSFSTGSITVTGGNINAVGGISGASNGLSNSYSTMSITINGNGTFIGGGVGRAINGVSNSYSTGNVVVTGTGTDVGGFLGSANSSLSNNFTSSNVTVGSGSLRVGGFSGSQTLNLGPTESYSTGTVTAPNSTNVGGFIGLNESGTFSHSNYTTSRVLAAGSTNVGGYVGNNQGTMTNFYSTGIVTGTTNVGGAVGVNTGTISNAYWDMGTSGQATSAAGSGRTTAQMFTQSNYNTWSFPTNWTIAEGKSYPYLTDAYPTGARAISGLTGASGDVATQLAVAGVNFDTVNTGANGFFYFLEGDNAYSGIDKTIADNTAVLIYLNNGSSFGNVVIRTPSSGASITGLSAAANFVGIGSSDTASFSITDLTNAKGGLSSTNILYSTSGNDITVGNASHTTAGISTTATSTFSLTGNISPTGGGSASMTFSGPVTLATTPTLDAGVTGVITISGNITGNSNALVISNGSGAGTSSISGALGNTLTALTKNGTGVLNISGANNTFTGTTTLNNGTLEIGVATNALGSNTLTLNSGTLRSSLTATLSNNYSLGGNVAIGGSNNLTLSGLGTLNSSNTLSVTNTATTTLSGNLNGSSNITENTTGTLIFSGANNSSYSGTTTLTAGTLQIGTATNALGTGTLALNGGFLQSSLTATLANPFSLGGNATINGSNNLTLSGLGTLTSGTLSITNTAITTLSGNLNSGAGITENTTGTVIISGTDNSSYSGTTTLTAGTLQIGVATNALGIGALTLNGGNLQSSLTASIGNSYTMGGSTTINGSNNLTLSGTGILNTGTLSITNSGITTLSGNISGSSGITENTSGTLSIAGLNNGSYSGTTTVTTGTLQIATTANGLGIGSLIMNGGTLLSSLSASLGNNFTIGGSVNFGGTNNLTLSGSGTLNSTLNVTNTANAISLNGALSGGSGITQNGNGGTLILGNSGNSYGGDTTITAGTLQLGTANTIPNTSNVSVSLNALFDMNNNSDTIGSLSGAGNVNMAGATLTTANNNSTSFSGVMNGTGGNFVKGGSGTFTISGNQTYTGSTTINAGTITLGIANALPITTALSVTGTLELANFTQEVATVTGAGTVTNSSGTLSTFTVNNSGANTFSGLISGNINLAKSSGGTLTLNSANTYAGSTTINAGTIALGIANALPITTLLTATGILELSNFAQQVAGLSGAGTIINSSGALTNFTVNNSSAATFTGAINGNINLVKSAAGVFTVSGSSNYAGSTNVTGGTLRLNASNILPNTTDVTLAGSTVFDLNNSSETIGSIAGSGNITLGSGSLTTSSNSSTTYSGNISGSGGFTKGGGGTLILSGSNNYSGATTVNGGTLQIDSAQGLSPLTSNSSVNTGATLAINNVSVNGGTFLLDGGTLNGIGNATFNAPINLATNSNSIISANAGANFAITGDVNGASDLLMQGAGAITITGNVGDVARLNSVTTNSSKSITGSVYTTGNQNYGHDTTLVNDVTYDSSNGSIILNNIVNGAFNLIVNSSAATTFAQAVGGVSQLTSLIVSSSVTNINGGSVITSGTQTYNSPVALGANTQLTGTTLALNSGVIGGTNLTMNGTTLTVSGTIALNDFTAMGTGGSNTLNFNGNNTQTWSLNAGNSGTISSASIVGSGTFNTIHHINGGGGSDIFNLNGGTIAGNINGGSGSNTLTAYDVVNTWTINTSNGGTVTGIGGNFSNMQTLNGGNSSDTFTLSGGSVSGSIDGGAGTNSLLADNVATTWNISGTDSGNLTNVSSFSSIQNITGGNANNEFNFADNAVITGTLDGGSLANTNIINYTAYSTPITVQLGTDIFDGSTINQSSTVTNFVNINSLFANRTKVNLLNMPQKMNQVVMTGALDGFVNDPLFFNGFTFFTGATSGTNTVSFNVPVQINYANHTAVINGVTMTFNNFIFIPAQPPSPSSSFDVSRIVQQPIINGAYRGSWIWFDTSDVNTMINTIYAQYDDYLRSIRVDPYCHQAANYQ